MLPLFDDLGFSFVSSSGSSLSSSPANKASTFLKVLQVGQFKLELAGLPSSSSFHFLRFRGLGWDGSSSSSTGSSSSDSSAAGSGSSSSDRVSVSSFLTSTSSVSSRVPHLRLRSRLRLPLQFKFGLLAISTVDSSSVLLPLRVPGIQVRERKSRSRMRWVAGRQFPAVFRVVRKTRQRGFRLAD